MFSVSNLDIACHSSNKHFKNVFNNLIFPQLKLISYKAINWSVIRFHQWKPSFTQILRVFSVRGIQSTSWKCYGLAQLTQETIWISLVQKEALGECLRRKIPLMSLQPTHLTKLNTVKLKSGFVDRDGFHLLSALLVCKRELHFSSIVPVLLIYVLRYSHYPSLTTDYREGSWNF